MLYIFILAIGSRPAVHLWNVISPREGGRPDISLSVELHTSGFGVLVKGLRRLSLTLR